MAKIPSPLITVRVDISQCTVKNPLGWMAGVSDSAWQALWNISIEMLAHRSDLMEDAQREERKTGGIPLFAQHDAAMLLEKYATAITIVAIQMMTPDQLNHSRLDGLTELAEKHELFLPEEFKVKKDGEG